MITRLLLAVDDTVDSLAATRFAIGLAQREGCLVRALHVSPDGVLDEALRSASSLPGAPDRRGRAEAAVLARVEALARAGGVPVETVRRRGEVGRTVLEEARRWRAELVVVGKSARSAGGEPYVGPVTRHVLEFSEQPVLVVPPPDARRTAGP